MADLHIKAFQVEISNKDFCIIWEEDSGRLKAATRQYVELAQTAFTLSDLQCQPNCFTCIVWNCFLFGIYVWFQKGGGVGGGRWDEENGKKGDKQN